MSLKPNKTLTFHFSKKYRELEGSRIFVRTGTFADGNCFYHSLLRAIDSKYRKQTEYDDFLQLVLKFKEDLAEWVSFDKLKNIGSGEHYKMLFLKEFNEFIQNDTSFKSNTIEEPYLKIIRQIFTPQIIENQITPNALMYSTDESFYLKFCKYAVEFMKNKLKGIDAKRLSILSNKVYDYFVEIFQQVHHNTLENFKHKLGKNGEYTDSLQLECIAQYTGYNFVFINNEESDSYVGQTHSVSFDDNKKTLIFLWVDENHFEIIGELEPEKFVNRIFVSNDRLVQALVLGYATSKSK